MMRTDKAVLLLAGLIAILAAAVSALGIFWQGGDSSFTFTNLHGQSVAMQGRGVYQFASVSFATQGIAQDVVTLFVGIPLLIVATVLYQSGSLRGRLLFSGTLGYFLYTYASYAFGVAYNGLFLVYTVIFAASLYCFILALMSTPVDELPVRFAPTLPTRFFAGLLLFIGAMLALLWLGRIVPPLLSGGTPYVDQLSASVTGIRRPASPQPCYNQL